MAKSEQGKYNKRLVILPMLWDSSNQPLIRFIEHIFNLQVNKDAIHTNGSLFLHPPVGENQYSYRWFEKCNHINLIFQCTRVKFLREKLSIV